MDSVTRAPHPPVRSFYSPRLTTRTFVWYVLAFLRRNVSIVAEVSYSLISLKVFTDKVLEMKVFNFRDI